MNTTNETVRIIRNDDETTVGLRVDRSDGQADRIGRELGLRDVALADLPTEIARLRGLGCTVTGSRSALRWLSERGIALGVS